MDRNAQLDAAGAWGQIQAKRRGRELFWSMPADQPTAVWWWPGAVPAYGNYVNTPAAVLRNNQQVILSRQQPLGVTASAEQRGMAVQQALRQTYAALVKAAKGA